MSEGHRAALAAMLYDWHNSLILRAQSQDVDFWIRVLPAAQRVVVMGAGTGRVAVPLARAGHSVVAVDRDRYRLARIPEMAGLITIHSDFSDLRSAATALSANQVIFPYSTLQLIPPDHLSDVLSSAAEQLAPNADLWIDVSNRFESRSDHEWHTVLDAPCTELGTVVIERQKGTRCSDHYRIDTLFLTPSCTLVELTESWYFLDDADIEAALGRSCLTLISGQEGYGTSESRHRRIYKARLTIDAVAMKCSLF